MSKVTTAEPTQRKVVKIYTPAEWPTGYYTVCSLTRHLNLWSSSHKSMPLRRATRDQEISMSMPCPSLVSWLWIQLKSFSLCRAVKATIDGWRSVVHETWQLVRLARSLCNPSLPTRRRRSSDTGGPPTPPGDAGVCPSSSSSSAATESSCSRACISSSRNIPLMLTSSFADT